MRFQASSKLTLVLAFFFAELAHAPSAGAVDPTVVKVDSGSVRGVTANGVTSFK